MRIKGHTEIQLRNAKTGYMVQNTHDDNMVTNGLAGFLKNHGVLNNTPFVGDIANDYITNLFGGIMLFNDTLTASADTVLMPDGVKMTANGAYGTLNSGAPSELGSYDANESGWQDSAHTTFRLVYNWTESQGNGVIKSAALTSKIHGLIGEGNASSGTALVSGISPETDCGTKQVGRYEGIIMAIKNNTAYTLDIDTAAQEFTIGRMHISDTELALNDSVTLQNSIIEEIAVHSNPSSVITLKRDLGKAVHFLMLSNKAILTLRGNEGIIVVELSSNLETITDYYDVTNTATGLDWLSNGIAFLTSAGDYLVCADNANSAAYKVEVASPVNVTAIIKDSDAKMDYPYYSAGKRHYFRNGVYDETLDKIYITNGSNGALSASKAVDVYKTDKTFIVIPSTYQDNVSCLRNNAYIATVNNLQSTVTKDSSQTMKVIYTLTFS